MTDADDHVPHGDVPPGDAMEGPLSLELLADLHAGVLDEQAAAQLRLRIATDAQARAVLAALDATVAGLGALARQPAARIPEAVALRLDHALAAEAERRDRPAVVPPWLESGVPAGPVADLGARRRRRVAWSGVGLAAAAAVAAVVALSSGQLAGMRLELPGTPRAGEALTTATGVQPAAPMALTRGSLGTAVDEALGAHDFGPLSPLGMMDACLEANGVADADLLGAMEVTMDGAQGVLIVLPTGRRAQLRLLVVGPDCGPGNPSPIADAMVNQR